MLLVSANEDRMSFRSPGQTSQLDFVELRTIPSTFRRHHISASHGIVHLLRARFYSWNCQSDVWSCQLYVLIVYRVSLFGNWYCLVETECQDSRFSLATSAARKKHPQKNEFQHRAKVDS